MSKQLQALPKELRTLVDKCVFQLGQSIQEEAGIKFYNLIESIRLNMVSYRSASKKKKKVLLSELYEKIKKVKSKNQEQIAHAFTLMLEIINSCESAYRTFRLKENKKVVNLEQRDNAITYILTAHPTEARTEYNIELFRRIQNIALKILEKSGEETYLLSIIKHNIKLAWVLPITHHEKPQVLDEAEHLFSILLRPDLIDTLLRVDRDLGKLRIGTWVGGDKDGHPGVDEKVMLSCLQSSRNHFISLIQGVLDLFLKDIKPLKIQKLQENCKQVLMMLINIQKIQVGDARKVKKFKQSISSLNKDYIKIVGTGNPRIQKLTSILKIFPGLVVPIELREDSSIIKEALDVEKPLAITRMLITLQKISEGGSIRCYTRNIIISMCESFDDVSNTMSLLKKNIKNQNLPIVPLFETASALKNSHQIVTQMLLNKRYSSLIQKKWSNQLEIMLGYSDSSKGMGVFSE